MYTKVIREEIRKMTMFQMDSKNMSRSGIFAFYMIASRLEMS
jgi:hypothetical protein